jgi:hypothetical protein
MTTSRALPSSRNTMRKTARNLAAAVVALGLSFSAAHAASDRPTPPHANTSSWGAGPIMLSLLDSARHEAPLRGVDPALKAGHKDQPIQAANTSYHPPIVPTPVAYAPFNGR